MGWVYLLVSGVFEVGFASLLKTSDGFKRLWPSVGLVVCICCGFFFLGKSQLNINSIANNVSIKIICEIDFIGKVYLREHFNKKTTAHIKNN